MERQIPWLRISYLVGAAADAFFAVAMVHPPLLQAVLRLPRLEVTVQTRSVLGMGAPLMIGWAVLLLWANLKPVERKGVLLITVFPVLAGLAVTALYGLVSGYLPFFSAAGIWLFDSALASLFLFSYARASERDGTGPRDVAAGGRTRYPW
jgi:hypothetical protein